MTVAELGIKIATNGAQEAATGLDQVAKASARAERAVESLGASSKRVNDLGANVRRLSDYHQQAARSAGLHSMQVQQLGYQLNDIATSLASGQGLLQTAAQQSGQVYQALTLNGRSAGASLKEIGGLALQGAGRLSGFVASGRGAVGILAAIAAQASVSALSWQSLNRDIQNTVSGVAKASGATTGGVLAQARAIADPWRMSEREAAGGLAQIYSTGRINTEIGGQIGQMLPDLAKRFGVSIEDAGRLAAKAFSDPSKGAEELAARLGDLDDRTLQLIRSMQAAGNVTGAQALMLEKFKAATKDAATETNGLIKLLNLGANALSSYWDAQGRTVNRLLFGGTFEEQIAAAEAKIKALRVRLSDLQRNGEGWNEVGATKETQSQLEEAIKAADVLQRRRQANARDAEQEQLNLKSLQIGDAIRGFDPEMGRKLGLENLGKLLKEAVDNPELRAKLDDLGTSFDEVTARVAVARRTFESYAQRTANDYSLQLASATATTLGQRAAIEAERSRLETLRAFRTESEAATAAERARTLVIADATRTLREGLKDSQRDLALLGKYGLQRDLQQLRNEREAELERNRLTPSGVPRVQLAPLAPSPLFSGLGLATQFYGLPIPAAVPTPTAPPAITGMNADFRSKLQALIDAVGGIKIGSGFRTYEQQERLYREKPHLAAPPGRSNHEFGLAADLEFASDEVMREAHRRAAEFGLRFPMLTRAPGKKFEPWHVEPTDARAIRAGMPPSGPGAAPADATVQRDLDRLTNEKYNNRERFLIGEREAGPLREANLALEAQQRLTAALGSQIGMTAREIDKANAIEQLSNQYRRDGVKITPDLAREIETYGNAAADAAEKQRKLNETTKSVSDWNSTLASSTGGFLSDMARGTKAADALRNALLRLTDKAITSQLESLFNVGGPGGGFLGAFLKGLGLFSGGPMGSSGMISYSALGNVFAPSGLHAFANGAAFTNSIVSRPTLFPFKNGTGLMGEAGPEAIMPLRRDSSGRLGVHAQIARGAATNAAPTIVQPKMAINIQNYGPTHPQVEQRQESDGSTVWDVVIPAVGDRLAADMRRGQGPLAHAADARMRNTHLRG